MESSKSDGWRRIGRLGPLEERTAALDTTMGIRRAAAGVAALALLAGAAPSTSAQTPADCLDLSEPTPEVYGPTDITATSGNQRLSVALNSDATVTVLKWPSPSFYDQIKYRTTDRAQPRLGAAVNEGAFVGLAYRSRGQKDWGFSWLRSWRSSQRFRDADSDGVVTIFRNAKVGLAVTLIDVVVHDRDVVSRRVLIDAIGGDDTPDRVRVFSFANFNPVFSKNAQAPLNDWCTEDDDDDGATYRRKRDAIVASRSGIDASTGEASSVALAMRFADRSDGHSVGADTYESPGTGSSAYDDARDGTLSGTGSGTGQTDVALFDEVTFELGSASTEILIGAGATPTGALKAVDEVAGRSPNRILVAKTKWYERWLKNAPLPKNAPGAVVRLAKRALISLRQVIDADTADVDDENQAMAPGDLMVASIATQAPYGQDWIRHGAYFNYALELAGHPEIVERHNRRYAVLQNKTGDSPRGGQPIPPGNWAMNYYADGVVGGTIPYEIDETGYGIWTLWEHYRASKDESYLNSAPIYEAIQRAAQYLTDTCRDLTNGLQCVANEDDNTNPSQTLRGAMLVWLGLDSAVKTARVRDTPDSLANAELWETRRDELAGAIEDEFFDQACGCYTEDYEDGGTLLWPVGFLVYGSERADAQADANWEAVAPAFDGAANRGRYEAKALLGNAHAWAGRPQKRAQLKDALRWVATVPTTNETGILGEAWMHYPNQGSPVVTMVSQPHVLQQVLFYLAALEVFGKSPYR